MSRLLSPEEQLDIRAKIPGTRSVIEFGTQVSVLTAEAQAAHSERRERTGLAEWLDEDCFDHGHLKYEDGSSTAKRRNCPQCWGRLVRALRNGKAPTPSGQWPEGE